MPGMEKQTISNLTELSVFAHRLHEALLQRDGKQATVVGLHGDLGSGKTTLVQHLARAFGVTQALTSPTFIIMQSFPLTPGQATTAHYDKLVHVDAYRIEDTAEMRVLDFESLLEEPHTIIFIEWAEKIDELLPRSTIHVTFTIAPNEDREIYVDGL